jgi:hypothetical protein
MPSRQPGRWGLPPEPSASKPPGSRCRPPAQGPGFRVQGSNLRINPFHCPSDSPTFPALPHPPPRRHLERRSRRRQQRCKAPPLRQDGEACFGAFLKCSLSLTHSFTHTPTPTFLQNTHTHSPPLTWHLQQLLCGGGELPAELLHHVLRAVEKVPAGAGEGEMGGGSVTERDCVRERECVCVFSSLLPGPLPERWTRRKSPPCPAVVAQPGPHGVDLLR